MTKVIKDIDGWFEYDIDDPVANNRVGETIYAIGFPYGINSLASTIEPKYGQISNQIQNGIITQYRGLLNFGHNVPVANGMSGSPIINDKGSLVGIHATGYTGLDGVQGMNQGVSANLLYKCVLDWDTYNNNK
ncbi:MAG: trypsin-like peptidase domain-containing protein [Prevotella sp.]|nr:trypsin-like peptidase domain-containing protein [Prevotella sp.]